MKYSRFTHVTVALALLLAVTWTIFGQDGPPGEFGPTDPHRLSPTGLNQKVLVIYVQASDFQIVPGNGDVEHHHGYEKKQSLTVVSGNDLQPTDGGYGSSTHQHRRLVHTARHATRVRASK